MDIKKYIVPQNVKINLSDYPTEDTGDFKSKDEALKKMKKNVKKMIKLQDKLYAEDKHSLLLIFQGMDAAGKDGMIKHVMSGLNPQGTSVVSFKQPSKTDLDHDYLWRISKELPERGKIGIFNRSHYEEVLVVRVHDLISKSSQFPEELVCHDIWDKRFTQLNNFEKYLFDNGTIILKFFLHMSKEEQKNRFLKRIEDKSKNWKFSSADIKERQYWDDYNKAFEEALSKTSKKNSPWYVIPADIKWYGRLLVSEIIVSKLKSLKLKYPELSEEGINKLQEAKKILSDE